VQTIKDWNENTEMQPEKNVMAQVKDDLKGISALVCGGSCESLLAFKRFFLDETENSMLTFHLGFSPSLGKSAYIDPLLLKNQLLCECCCVWSTCGHYSAHAFCSTLQVYIKT